EMCTQDFSCHLTYPALYAVGLWAVYFITGLVLAAALLFALVSRAPQSSRDHVRTIILYGVGALLCAGAVWLIASEFKPMDPSMWLVATALVLTGAVWLVISGSELLTPRSLNASYWLRRTTERILGTAFVPSLAVLVFATIPIIPFFGLDYISTHGP